MCPHTDTRTQTTSRLALCPCVSARDFEVRCKPIALGLCGQNLRLCPHKLDKWTNQRFDTLAHNRWFCGQHPSLFAYSVCPQYHNDYYYDLKNHSLSFSTYSSTFVSSLPCFFSSVYLGSNSISSTGKPCLSAL